MVPNFTNHTVTGFAVLFAGFEKTSISCGFAGYTYGTICHIATVKTAMQAIKNPCETRYLTGVILSKRNNFLVLL